MFISEAHAQTASAAAANSTGSWLMIAVLFLVMWLFVLRPQAKRQQEHANLIKGLRRGNKIVTDSGIYAEVTKVVDDSIIEVEIASGVKVRLVRNAVAAVLNENVEDKKEVKKSTKKTANKANKTTKKTTTKKKAS